MTFMGKEAIRLYNNIKDGEIILLDNVRFDDEEIKLSKFMNDNFDIQRKSKMVRELSSQASFRK